MSKTFLQLTNRVLKALNEVQLTSAQFEVADGFAQEAKDSVNSAIFDVYTEEDIKWSFAYNKTILTTVVGIQEYTPVSEATTIIWHSFGIEKNPLLNIPARYLSELNYATYLKTRWDNDLEATFLDEYSTPDIVVRLPNNNILISHKPDKEYQIEYGYYTIPSALVQANDVVSIPDAFEQVIIDKALHYAYMFRDNMEQAQIVEERYKKNADKMRRILIPQFHNIVPL